MAGPIMLLRVLGCALLGRLTVRSWAVLPLLFIGSAGGVAALLNLLLEPDTLDGELSLSAPLLFGFAAGLTILSANHVRWKFRWQRTLLRVAYPIGILACAVGLDGLAMPMTVALLVGPIAAMLMATILVRARRDHDDAECLHV